MTEEKKLVYRQWVNENMLCPHEMKLVVREGTRAEYHCTKCGCRMFEEKNDGHDKRPA